MITRESISKGLNDLGFDTQVLNRYDESHRFYHTMDHLIHVLNVLEQKGKVNTVLFLSAVYHDAIYSPTSSTNEEDSAALFLKEASGNKNISESEKKEIEQIILDTKTHQAHSEQSKQFIAADLSIFDKPLEELIRYEHQISKEFQFVDYKVYQEKRVEVLEKFNTNGRLNALIAYVKQRKPLIGVFAGSFNPFHRGHYNVLQKAERIFDKVIIAFGKNPDKLERTWPIPSQIKNRQLTEYIGLLTDFVDSLGYDVIVVRGLRNSTDFQYEQNQYRYIQELKPDIKIINVFCDKEFEHISSSGIRTLEKYEKHHQYLLE
jgi:pantetheine-phosphate adenylyltransferase